MIFIYFLLLSIVEQVWFDLCDNPYGIIIEPEQNDTNLKANSIIKVCLLVYAKVWGIYIDEIVVELQNLPFFTFSLILEVVGSPIEFPIALNTNKALPTIK